MSEWRRTWQSMWLSGAVLTLAACASSNMNRNDWTQVSSPPRDQAETLRIVGKVLYLDIEGGVLVIVDAQGTRYEPTNLPEAFRSDGIDVEVEARRQTDIVSVAMVGPIVELIRIRQIPSAPAR